MTAPCPELGFSVIIQPVGNLDAGALNALRDALVDLLEHRGLYCRVGGDAARLEYAVASDASQATEIDREAAMEWLRARTDVERWNVGALIDLREPDER